MSPIKYLVPRVIRHFMPDKAVRFLLLKSWIIRPGLETNQPALAATHYIEELTEAGYGIKGKRILVFGYGGRFAVGCSLVKNGAAQVILCEKGAPPDDGYNRQLLTDFDDLLVEQDSRVRPKGDQLKLVQGDIRQLAQTIGTVDIVLSVSVYEHLDDVPGITAALAAVTAPDGIQIHFVDLRDHFFKYPFEMLCYDEKTWRTWLNPTSNHNRYRLDDYRRTFETYFNHVDIKITGREETAFNKTKNRIRPEFLSGDETKDNVTLIRVVTSGLKNHPGGK